MTLKRCQALKEAWKRSPPASVCLAAICEFLGLKIAGDDDAPAAGREECFYDESYYDVGIQDKASLALSKDFERINGGG